MKKEKKHKSVSSSLRAPAPQINASYIWDLQQVRVKIAHIRHLWDLINQTRQLPNPEHGEEQEYQEGTCRQS